MDFIFGLSYLLLWTITLALFVGLFVVYRHLGRQLITSYDRRLNQGPARVPSMELHTLAGETLTVAPNRARALFLFFATATCKPCKEALPALGRFAERSQPFVDTVVVCRAVSDQAIRDFATGVPTSVRVVADRGWDVAGAMRIAVAPYALIADGSLAIHGRGSPRTDLDFEWFLQRLTSSTAPTILPLAVPVQVAQERFT